ncbi:MAG: ComEC/Rec2 family competence protein [Candidatus Paceibacterota bacterium]
MSASKILFWLSISFIVGVGANSFFNIIPLLLLGGSLWGGLVLIVSFWEKKAAVVGLCFFIFAFGAWYHHQALIEIDNNDVQEHFGKEVELVGRVVEEPDSRPNRIKLTIGNFEDIKGKILITTIQDYDYGDELRIKGEVKEPAVFEGFNYKKYLEKDGIYGVMYYPRVKLIEKNFTAYGSLLKLKDKFRQVLYNNFSPPQSEILGAMLLGDKQRLSDSLKDSLNKAGLRHVTAVSGMHVVIVMSAGLVLLVGLGLSRSRAFWGALLLIALFTALTGFQVSTIRAASLGGLFLVGQYLGRKKASYRALALVAVIMLLFNPLLLKRSVGFQLSFLAVLGIMSTSSIIKGYLKKVPDWFSLRSILAMTFSAQLFVLPVLIYHFGRFSLITPLSNILIIPLLPYLMGLGFVFLLGGLIWSKLGWLLALPLWLLVTFVVKVVQFLSKFPFLYQSVSVGWFFIVAYYFLLALVIWRIKKKQELSFLKY